jgi:flavin-dependent dehydrogenase
MLMAGDAAGVIDPFAGQGQAGALASGILAGETILSFLDTRVSAERFPAAYRAAWRRRFASPFAWSARLRQLMLDPTLGTIAARIGGPALVRFGIRHLSRGRDGVS